MSAPDRSCFHLAQTVEQALWHASQTPPDLGALKRLSTEVEGLVLKTVSQKRLVLAGQGTLLVLGKTELEGWRFPVPVPFPFDHHWLICSTKSTSPAAIELLRAFVLELIARVSDESVSIELADLVGLGAELGPILTLVSTPGSPIVTKPATSMEELKEMFGRLRSHAESVLQDRLQGAFSDIVAYQRAGSPNGPIRYIVAVVRGLALPNDPQTKACLESLIKNGIRAGVFLIIEGQRDEFSAHPWFSGPTCRKVLLHPQSGVECSVFGLRGGAGRTVSFGTADARMIKSLADSLAQEATSRSRTFVYEDFLRIASIHDPLATFKGNAAERLELFLGADDAGRLCGVGLGSDLTNHVLVAGRSGSGKSNLLHVIITAAARTYAPSELAVHLVDLKQGVEFRAYADPPLRHAKTIVIQGEREACLGVLRIALGELEARGNSFRSAKCQDFRSYRLAGHELPRVLIIIDEFQVVFDQDDEIAQESTKILEKLAREGRAFGIHLVLATQTLFSARLSRATLAQFAVRIALPCDDADSRLILADDNGEASSLTRPGEAIINRSGGHKGANQLVRTPFLPASTLMKALAFVAGRPAKEASGRRPPVIYDGTKSLRRGESSLYAEALDNLNAESHLRLLLGESTMLDGIASVDLRREPQANVLIIGGMRGGAAKGLLDAVAQSLAVQSGEKLNDVIVYDPAHLLPDEVPWARHSEPELVANLRQLREAATLPQSSATVLLALGLDRAVTLKNEPVFGKPVSPEPPADVLAGLLRSGPENGTHVIAWAGSWQQYLLADPQRRWLKLFDVRICFALSEEDSMMVLDKRWAMGLDAHTALWRSMKEPAPHRFRPFAPETSEEPT